jgi:hypothetical protein
MAWQGSFSFSLALLETKVAEVSIASHRPLIFFKESVTNLFTGNYGSRGKEDLEESALTC